MDEELGERECTCPEIVSKHPQCECDRKHFNNFLWATVTVFQVSEYWVYVLKHQTNPTHAPYFKALHSQFKLPLFQLLLQNTFEFKLIFRTNVVLLTSSIEHKRSKFQITKLHQWLGITKLKKKKTSSCSFKTPFTNILNVTLWSSQKYFFVVDQIYLFFYYFCYVLFF